MSRRGRAGARAAPSRFLGVDLAWRHDRPSGVVSLVGQAFPLRLRDADVVTSHVGVLDWVRARADGGPTAVGIDAPLLGLSGRRRRRPCDDQVARAFGRFHASTHSLPSAPDLRRFAAVLRRRYGARSLAPGVRPAGGRPAIREVYPNALQVLLFDLERGGATIVPYKLRRFGGVKAKWVTGGLRPFIARCRRVLEAAYVDRRARAWRDLVALAPRETMTVGELKAIEDRWDAVLCAVAVALEHLAPGTMHAYAGGRAGWRGGYILAPTLTPAVAGSRGSRPRRAGLIARPPAGREELPGGRQAAGRR